MQKSKKISLITFYFFLITNFAFAKTGVYDPAKLPEIKEAKTAKEAGATIPQICKENKIPAACCAPPDYGINNWNYCSQFVLKTEATYKNSQAKRVYRFERICFDDNGYSSSCLGQAKQITSELKSKESGCFSTCQSVLAQCRQMLGRGGGGGECLIKNFGSGSACRNTSGQSAFDRCIIQNSPCYSNCADPFRQIADEVADAEKEALADWRTDQARPRVSPPEEEPAVTEAEQLEKANKERYFRPLIGRGPHDLPGVEISAHGYFMSPFLKEFAEENNTSFYINYSDGNLYLIRTDNQAQVLFEGIGVHQGEDLILPLINAGTFSAKKGGTGFSARISGAEGFASAASVDTVSSPGSADFLQPKLEIKESAPPGEHQIELIVTQDGEEVAKIPLIVEVEEPQKKFAGFLYVLFGILAVSLFWGGIFWYFGWRIALKILAAIFIINFFYALGVRGSLTFIFAGLAAYGAYRLIKSLKEARKKKN